MNPQPQQIDITSKDVSIEQLKALCYDQILVLNQAQANINALQAEINKRTTNEAPIKPE